MELLGGKAASGVVLRMSRGRGDRFAANEFHRGSSRPVPLGARTRWWNFWAVKWQQLVASRINNGRSDRFAANEFHHGSTLASGAAGPPSAGAGDVRAGARSRAAAERSSPAGGQRRLAASAARRLRGRGGGHLRAARAGRMFVGRAAERGFPRRGRPVAPVGRSRVRPAGGVGPAPASPARRSGVGPPRRAPARGPARGSRHPADQRRPHFGRPRLGARPLAPGDSGGGCLAAQAGPAGLGRAQARELAAPGRDGVRKLRQVLEDCRARGRPLDSALEVKFWWLLRRSGLPLPEPQADFEDEEGQPCRIDFAYCDTRLAVEVDGFEFHSKRDAFERDRVRLSRLAVAGWRVIHVTAQQLREPKVVLGRIRAALAFTPPARGPPHPFQ
jgi:very-short-patch-repair endonuclease